MNPAEGAAWVSGSATVPEPARPDVLAYPSPTSVRFLILVVATLSAGLFVGDWVHTIVLGDRWQRQVQACDPSGAAAATVTDPFAQQAQFEACMAPDERQRALFSIAGLAVTGIGGALALYVAPVLVKRRRRLRPAGPKLAATTERFEQLARDAGLTRVPALMIGSAAQRDAFSYGVPARYRVVLPPGVAIRPRSPGFQALVAHELAHVARRDVTVAWLARSVGYAVVPVLVLPVLLALVTGDLSLVPDYIWRAVLLGAVIALTRAAILRSREHDADLRAARHGSDVPALSALLSSIPDKPRTAVRRLFANHPTVRARIEVLHRPAGVARIGFVDGLTVAFLAALVPPLIELAVVPLLTGTGHVGRTDVVAAVLAGPLVGGAIGLGLWRAALVRRITGTPVRLAPVVAGMFAGMVLGGATSLAQSGVGVLDREGSPLFLAVTGLCAAGATVTVAGLGELWADAAGRLRSARVSWLAAVILPGIVFAAVLWAAATTQKALQGGGWTMVRLLLPEYFDNPPMLAASLVLAAAAAWALWAARSGALTPAWLLESGPRHDWPRAGSPSLSSTAVTGAAAGIAGAAVLISFRVIAGASVSDAETLQRFYTYVLVATAAAAAGALVLALLAPGRGAGAALLAVPIATTVTMAGFLVLNTVLGGKLGAPFVGTVLRKPLGLAVLAEMLVVSVVLLPPVAWRPPRLLIPATAAVTALLATTAVTAGRDFIAPPPLPQLPRIPAGTQTAPPGAAREIADYRDRTAPAILRQFTTVAGQAGTIDADPSLDPQSRAAAIRQQIVTPLRQLADQADGVTATVPQVRAAHAVCRAGLRDSVAAYESWAVAYETGDPQARATALDYEARGLNRLRTWAELVQTF
jgi:Zn-dependent protease with chaperone function